MPLVSDAYLNCCSKMIKAFELSLLILSLLSVFIHASPSPDAPSSTHNSVKRVSPRQESNQTAANRASVPSTSLASNFNVLCSGERYRTNLIGASCIDAVQQIPLQDQILTFQTRERGPYDALLPTRFISGTWPLVAGSIFQTDLLISDRTADGKCIVEPVLEDNAEKAFASYNYISRAAYDLLYKCALRSHVGGLATDIGV